MTLLRQRGAMPNQYRRCAAIAARVQLEAGMLRRGIIYEAARRVAAAFSLRTHDLQPSPARKDPPGSTVARRRVRVYSSSRPNPVQRHGAAAGAPRILFGPTRRARARAAAAARRRLAGAAPLLLYGEALAPAIVDVEYDLACTVTGSPCGSRAWLGYRNTECCPAVVGLLLPLERLSKRREI